MAYDMIHWLVTAWSKYHAIHTHPIAMNLETRYTVVAENIHALAVDNTYNNILYKRSKFGYY